MCHNPVDLGINIIIIIIRRPYLTKLYLNETLNKNTNTILIIKY